MQKLKLKIKSNKDDDKTIQQNHPNEYKKRKTEFQNLQTKYCVFLESLNLDCENSTESSVSDIQTPNTNTNHLSEEKSWKKKYEQLNSFYQILRNKFEFIQTSETDFIKNSENPFLICCSTTLPLPKIKTNMKNKEKEKNWKMEYEQLNNSYEILEKNFEILQIIETELIENLEKINIENEDFFVVTSIFMIFFSEVIF